MLLEKIERLGNMLMFRGWEAARSSARGLVAELRADHLGVAFHAGLAAFQLPERAGALVDVRTLVLEVMPAAEVLHVHRRFVGLAHVERHALRRVGLLAVLHLQQRAMRED